MALACSPLLGLRAHLTASAAGHRWLGFFFYTIHASLAACEGVWQHTFRILVKQLSIVHILAWHTSAAKRITRALYLCVCVVVVCGGGVDT